MIFGHFTEAQLRTFSVVFIYKATAKDSQFGLWMGKLSSLGSNTACF